MFSGCGCDLLAFDPSKNTDLIRNLHLRGLQFSSTAPFSNITDFLCIGLHEETCPDMDFV